jgi:hypothetical protein
LIDRWEAYNPPKPEKLEDYPPDKPTNPNTRVTTSDILTTCQPDSSSIEKEIAADLYMQPTRPESHGDSPDYSREKIGTTNAS